MNDVRKLVRNLVNEVLVKEFSAKELLGRIIDKNYKKSKPYREVLKDKEFTKEIAKSHFSEFNKEDKGKILLLMINALYNHVSKEATLSEVEDFIEDFFDVNYNDYNDFFSTIDDEKKYDVEVKSILNGPKNSIVNDIAIFVVNYFTKYEL